MGVCTLKTENPILAGKPGKMTYTVAEVAAILSVHKNTVYKLVKQKVFASKKIGTDIRISKTSFDEWFTKN